MEASYGIPDGDKSTSEDTKHPTFSTMLRAHLEFHKYRLNKGIKEMTLAIQEI